MLRAEDITNRMVTQEAAASFAGMPRGTLARVRYEHHRQGVEVPRRLTLADALSLHAAQKLCEFGVSATHAASAGHQIKGDWARVVEHYPTRFYMLARIAEEDGKLVVAVGEASEILQRLKGSTLVVDLTAVWEAANAVAEAWERPKS